MTAASALGAAAPPGTEPPEILNYSASNVPILQLGLSGDNLSEQQLNDLGLNFLRTQLVTVPGATIPYPYGGKQRQVTISFNPARLQAKGLSPTDVLDAVNAQNLVLPSGTAKISQFEYDVRTNAAPRTIEQLNDLPIRTVGDATIYLRDVATVNDGFAPQTNIVRLNGQRGVLVTVLKAGNASTINVVDDIRALLPRVGADDAAATPHQGDGRSVDLRQGRGRRCGARGCDRGVPDRADDPAVPRQLAQHADHCGVDPLVDPDVSSSV